MVILCTLAYLRLETQPDYDLVGKNFQSFRQKAGASPSLHPEKWSISCCVRPPGTAWAGGDVPRQSF